MTDIKCPVCGEPLRKHDGVMDCVCGWRSFIYDPAYSDSVNDVAVRAESMNLSRLYPVFRSIRDVEIMKERAKEPKELTWDDLWRYGDNGQEAYKAIRCALNASLCPLCHNRLTLHSEWVGAGMGEYRAYQLRCAECGAAFELPANIDIYSDAELLRKLIRNRLDKYGITEHLDCRFVEKDGDVEIVDDLDG